MPTMPGIQKQEWAREWLQAYTQGNGQQRSDGGAQQTPGTDWAGLNADKPTWKSGKHVGQRRYDM